jgi:hypothetical protein
VALTCYKLLKQRDVPLKLLIKGVPDKAQRLKAGKALWGERVSSTALLGHPLAERYTFFDVRNWHACVALTSYKALKQRDVPLKLLIKGVPDKAQRLKAGKALWGERVSSTALLVDPLAKRYTFFDVRKWHPSVALTCYESLKERDVPFKRLIKNVPDKVQRLKALSLI